MQKLDAPAVKAASPIERKSSIDVFRGMVMFLMLAELLHLGSLARAFPGNWFFEWVHFHTTHVEWEGCSLHDLIQPAFTFLVGVSMPFSIASRLSKGQSTSRLLLHAVWRSLVLIGLGIVLRSLGRDQTYFTFEDTLTQIGLGYFFVVLIALSPRWVHYASAFTILVLFWAAFAIAPPPPSDFDYVAVGVAPDWPHHHEGFASRWNINSNFSWRVDQWWMNLFPREEPFVYNSGGYSTLSFVPTMVTMIFGLIAGTWMKEPLTLQARSNRFLSATFIGIGVGLLLAWLDIVPLVKKIWTPSFTLYSGGWCMLWLYVLHLVCDVKAWTRWAFPFMVIGANSILIYVMSWTVADPISEMLVRHLGRAPFELFGERTAPIFIGAATLGIMYYVLLWLYRKRVFVKI
ncbi:hypothetical protein N9N28_00660 [Rubripirellula amarantea]|nr:hypothetical protein [Rubripirellula amarantea]